MKNTIEYLDDLSTMTSSTTRSSALEIAHSDCLSCKTA